MRQRLFCCLPDGFVLACGMKSDVPPVLPLHAHPPGPPKSRTGLYLVLGLMGAALLGLLFVLGGGALFIFTAKDEALSSDDRSALMTVSILSEWMEGFEPDLSKETVVKQRYLDRSYDMEYEFDDPDNPDAPYVSCSVTVEPNSSDALISYKGVQLGLNIGFNSQCGTSQMERNDLFRWGDQSSFHVLYVHGAPIGNSFTAIKGKRVFMMTFSGVFFEDTPAIQELLQPRLDALERMPAP